MNRSLSPLLFVALLALPVLAASPASDAALSTRLPPDVPPSLGCWFWTETEFAPEGYRPFLDLVARHSDYNILTTSLRLPDREVSDPAVLDQFDKAADYARARGIGLALDLDVRLARRAFLQAHPEELQEMLRLREVDLPASGEVSLTLSAELLSDHYTFRATPYLALAARLLRVYSFRTGPREIEAGSVEDITASHCRVAASSSNQVTVAIRGDTSTANRRACVMVAFAHFTPDVFAPHLMEFQRHILRLHARLPLAGVCKDEWGFPPCFDGCPDKNDFWFSSPYAALYAQRSDGRDLLRDCLLMCRGEAGRERERQAAINLYQRLAWERNASLERDFYRATKETFGSNALVATHPTWWPYPDLREFKKNGLHWWAAPRDYGQTDETTPFAVRTALAKKWGGPVWFNMFYSQNGADYERSLWSHALAGGRLNVHPLYPHDLGIRATADLLQGPLTRGAARIRLLNFISRSPLDCPVAVVFGHACAMNWAGPGYNDVGMAVADALWQRGWPADLIPTHEIQSGALIIDAEGRLQYGPQRYAAALLYHPEFEPPEIADFVRRAAEGRTALWRLGPWTRDFHAQPFDPGLPDRLTDAQTPEATVAQMAAHLEAIGLLAQTPATETIGWDRLSAAMPRSGSVRLLDGTVVVAVGTRAVEGDLIRTNLLLHGHPVLAEATGLLAVRLSPAGGCQALAAGGLTRFGAPGLTLQLNSPVDVALWRTDDGPWHGVLQDWLGPLPPPLAELTSDWIRLAVPLPWSPPPNP